LAGAETREPAHAEFPLVKEVWYHYHQQEANPAEDRIFGIFIDGTPTAVARCRASPGRVRSRRHLSNKIQQLNLILQVL
jgi:hypothetical protein